MPSFENGPTPDPEENKEQGDETEIEIPPTGQEQRETSEQASGQTSIEETPIKKDKELQTSSKGSETKQNIWDILDNKESDAEVMALSVPLEAVAKESNKKGVFVQEKDCHIDIDSFEEGGYAKTNIEADKKRVQEFEEEWNKNKNPEKERLRKNGEKFEMLTTILFQKNLGEDFIVMRTARRDDIREHVDTLLIDQKTGKPFCTFDEVVGKKDEGRVKDKIAEIREINQKGGAHIKYGFKLENGKIVHSPLDNVPLFYIRTDESTLKDTIKNLKPSLEEQSLEEKLLFDFLSDSINTQISEEFMREETWNRLNKQLKDNIKTVEERLAKFRKNKKE